MSELKNDNLSTDEFSSKIGRLTKSAAYLDFCEEVYGYREYFFNMMDKEQIGFVMNSIPVSLEDTVLDLGCGSGSILKLLTSKYGCSGIGIDRIDNVISEMGKPITYINGDIDNISDYFITPTITLSVDSLYFSRDQEKLVGQLKAYKNKMFFFYSQYIFDEAAVDRSILESGNTIIAAALNKNRISFKTVDFSENERRLYDNSLSALRKFKSAFELEGNTDLYEQIERENQMGKNLYKKGLASRYLYITELNF